MSVPENVGFVRNAHCLRGVGYPAHLHRALDPAGARAAGAAIRAWPGYAATPLRDRPGLAAALGLGAIHYKDEAGRFGLGSFKALGGAYAVECLVRRAVAARGGDDTLAGAALADARYREVTAAITVCSATDGNHGRAVAWGARTFGCRAVIYIHETVSSGREAAIAAYGARVVRVPGNYDESVRRAAADAAANGWTVVSDTSYEGYLEIPRDVMHGYTVMIDEALAQCGEGAAPTHVFAQGGVGGVAAAAVARTWWGEGPARPCVVVVEPARAACLLESARSGRVRRLTGDIETVMAGLSCGEPSLLAWQVLREGAHVFMSVGDDAAVTEMRRLADADDGDPPLVAGESAVAGLAGLRAACASPEHRRALGLGPDSRVLLLGTEGATDPDLYRDLVGRAPAAVAATD